MGRSARDILDENRPSITVSAGSPNGRSPTTEISGPISLASGNVSSPLTPAKTTSDFFSGDALSDRLTNSQLDSSEYCECQIWTDDRYREKRIDLNEMANTSDLELLDLVVCHAHVKVVGLDPKNGQFDLRMNLTWRLRTPNLGEHNEPRLRVPGVRVPSMSVSAEESRIWREYFNDTAQSYGWRGVSVFMMTGWEVFEVHDFPFDRQVTDLELLEFVWRRDKDETTFEEAMKVVEFTLDTQSLLPEWKAYPALVQAIHTKQSGSTAPSSAFRFRVRLRLERRKRFYIIQVFLLTTLITEASMFPLALLHGKDGPVGDRLALYSAGLLTLVAFKYSIAEQLPTVPYTTFLGKVLTAQMACLMFLSAEAVVSHKFAQRADSDRWEIAEDILLGLLCFGWLLFLMYVFRFKKRKAWKDVIAEQDEDDDQSTTT